MITTIRGGGAAEWIKSMTIMLVRLSLIPLLLADIFLILHCTAESAMQLSFGEKYSFLLSVCDICPSSLGKPKEIKILNHLSFQSWSFCSDTNMPYCLMKNCNFVGQFEFLLIYCFSWNISKGAYFPAHMVFQNIFQIWIQGHTGFARLLFV